jgi:DNA topoisomerase I
VNLTPEFVRSSLKMEHYRLYKLIWERFVACQMSDAQWDSTTVLVSGQDLRGELLFRASGRVLVFDGYYKVVGVPNESEEAVLPQMKEAQRVAPFQLDPVPELHIPAPRYTEASLGEKTGSRRNRPAEHLCPDYPGDPKQEICGKTKNRFYATDLGKVVTDKLVEGFPGIMQVGYTRDMEQQLDDIEEKQADWVEMLRQFYGPFKHRPSVSLRCSRACKSGDPAGSPPLPPVRRWTVYRFGRKGRFLSCAATLSASSQPRLTAKAAPFP